MELKDKSAIVRTILDRFNEDLELEKLKQSAELYAEEYEEDPDIRELTDTAIIGWPEW